MVEAGKRKESVKQTIGKLSLGNHTSRLGIGAGEHKEDILGRGPVGRGEDPNFLEVAPSDGFHAAIRE
ncbi:MAG TPA: hypothetical protein VFV02_17765 [Acidimicrobiales bacterium]|nr:hypothetical protein [Acidimicrobiales bacterium]